jgi:hypothetical protein
VPQTFCRLQGTEEPGIIRGVKERSKEKQVCKTVLDISFTKKSGQGTNPARFLT